MHSKLGLLLFTLFLSNSTMGIEKVIYGSDDRLDFYELRNENIKKMARATAAKIRNIMLDDQGDHYLVKGPSLEVKHNLCPSEPFAEQPATADCSGFIIAPNLLLTAGHCIEKTWQGIYPDCSRYSWAFDYSSEFHGQTEYKIKKENLYRCKKVVAQKLDITTRLDYAIIELDRPVTGRTPLTYRKSGKISKGEKLFVAGYPSGLPLKVSANATVLNNNNAYYFTTNLDTFVGNSGAPVFNGRTGVVEGIFMRGETDFIKKQDDWCKVSYKCRQNDIRGCQGEDIARITAIPELKAL